MDELRNLAYPQIHTVIILLNFLFQYIHLFHLSNY